MATASSGWRRLDPAGSSDPTVPAAITMPPSHSHATSGWTVTLRITRSGPVSSGNDNTAKATSSRRVERTDGIPMVWEANG